jgi:hypothetical protein
MLHQMYIKCGFTGQVQRCGACHAAWLNGVQSSQRLVHNIPPRTQQQKTAPPQPNQRAQLNAYRWWSFGSWQPYRLLCHYI